MLYQINYWIRNYFGFSQIETKGFIVLILLMVFILLLPSLFSIFTSPTKSISKINQQKFDSLVALIEANQPLEKKDFFNFEKQKNKSTNFISENRQELFYFDPNQISVLEWQKLGLKKRISENIMKYRKKGGIFRKKEDLLKIYGFPEDLYADLEPYIQLQKLPHKLDEKEIAEENIEKKSSKNFKNQENIKEITTFDLNQVDTSKLNQVKGIGLVLAQRIVDFREKLGGFYDITQIKEVYGLKPETIEELLKYATLSNPQVRKVNINLSEIDDLKKHPYIKYNLAKAIVNYRKQNGNFQSIEDLSKIKLMNLEIFKKLAPYLTL